MDKKRFPTLNQLQYWDLSKKIYIFKKKPPINQKVMKNISIFFIATLISLGFMFLSLNIADPELGIATIVVIWGIAFWLYFKRQPENSANQ